MSTRTSSTAITLVCTPYLPVSRLARVGEQVGCAHVRSNTTPLEQRAERFGMFGLSVPTDGWQGLASRPKSSATTNSILGEFCAVAASGVTETAAEAALVPIEFAAATVQLYVTPFVSPETMTGLAVLLPVIVAPAPAQLAT